MARANLGFKVVPDTAGQVNLVHKAEDGTETTVGLFTATATTLVAVTSSGNSVSTGSTFTATDFRATLGNLRLGTVSAFATTEPTNAVVMKTGTAPAGAITTSGGIFSNGTVVQKIIAAGTVSNVET